MIRGAWVLLNAALATLVFGSLVFLGSLLRVRGRLYDWIARQWAGAVMWSSGASVEVHGKSRIDWSRPHVVVCNHISAFDVLALALSIPSHFRFVAKKELERVPLFGPAWKAAGHISIDRQNRENAISSLKSAAAVLRSEGGAVVIFPEGTRSRTGELQPFKKGAFRLAIEAQVPIVPAVVVGSDRITPAAKLTVDPGRFQLYYGDPVETTGMDGEDVDELISTVRNRMEEMIVAGKRMLES